MRNRAHLRIVAALLLAWASLATAATAGGPRRVVALGGDITETICLLGAQQSLVGVDSTSLWPAAVTRLPDVGYVRQLGAEGVLALRPELIIATHDAGPPTTITQLREAGVALDLLPVSRTPADVAAKIRAIGRLLGRETQAETLAAQVERDYATLAARVAAMPRHPRVMFLMSAGGGSPMAAGSDTAASRMIALAGGRNAVDGYSGYKPVSAEALALEAPDVIVMMRETRDAVGDVAGVLRIPGMALTPAGKAQRVIFVDGQALLGFGPRSAAAALALQHALAAAS